MRNLKKVLSLSLALVMLLGMMIVGAGAATYSDVAEDSAKKPAIDVMSTIEVINGMGDGTFQPEGTLNRAQAATIVAKMLLGPATVNVLNQNPTECRFADVNATAQWASSAIQACVNEGVVAGYDATTFGPADKVTGVQFAAMLLRALDFDQTRYANNPSWNFNVRQDAIRAGLIANGVSITDEALKREDAAQMALNALEYSPEGAKTDFVVKREADGKVLYSGSNETAAYLVLNDANKNDKVGETPTATITTTTTNVGSLGQRQFGMTVTKTTDEMGRTAVNYKAPASKLDLTVAEPADYTFYNRVNNKAVYSAVGQTIANYTWNVRIEGEVADGKAPIKNDGTAYQGTTTGAVTELYVHDDTKIVDVVISYYHIGTVSKVVPATKDDPRYIMVAGKRYETENFAAKDMVVYTLENKAIAKVLPAPELTDTLTKIVNSTTYTLGSGTYVCAKYAEDVNLGWGNLGTDVTFYVDPLNNILKLKDQAAASAEYLYVVANSSARENPDYITSVQYPYSYMAYGIKADGTVEEWNIVEVDGKKIHPYETTWTDGDGEHHTYENVANNDGLHYKMYSYSRVGNSLRLTRDARVATEDIGVNNPNITYTGNKKAVANSQTSFVFFTTKSANDHTIVANSVKTGIANIGSKIEVKGTGLEAALGMDDTGTTVNVVFVTRPFDDGVSTEVGVAYLIAGTEKKTEWWQDGAKYLNYTYTGVDATGDYITLSAGSYKLSDDGEYGGTVWSFDEDNYLIDPLANESRQWTEDVIEYISRDAIKLGNVPEHAFIRTADTSVVYVDGSEGGELTAGDKVIMVTAASSGAKHWNAQVVYVTGAGTTGEAVKATEQKDDDGKVTGYAVSVSAGESFTIEGLGKYASGEGNTELDKTPIIIKDSKRDHSITDWATKGDVISDTMGFTYEASENATVRLTIKDAVGNVMYTEDGTFSGTYNMGLFYVQVVNTLNKVTTVYNSGTGSLAATELNKGTYTWSIIEVGTNKDGAEVLGDIVANGSFKIDNNGVNK